MKKWISIVSIAVFMLLVCSCSVPKETPKIDSGNTDNSSEEHGLGWDGLTDPEPIDYMGVEIKKDPSITDEQREFFFEFARTYCLNSMRTFEEGEQPALEDFKWYCVVLHGDQVKDLSIPGEIIEKTASELFGWTYGLKSGEKVSLEIGEVNGLPLAELINYKEEKAGGQTLVTLRYADYFIWPLSASNDEREQEEDELYATCREQIIKGKVTQKYELGFYEVQYYTEDGKTPSRFVSYRFYQYNEVPEFS